jgi:predicted Zn-ribbon and HTH transcriptional regulator
MNQHQPKRYWWECKHCGLVFKATSYEPESCPECKDPGCKRARGYDIEPDPKTLPRKELP